MLVRYNIKAKRRERKRLNRRKMGMSGRSIFTLLRIIHEKINEENKKT